MKIDSELLRRLEKLSALELNDSQREEMIKEFDDVLNFVDNLNEIDTNNIKIENSSFTPMREDEVKKSDVIVSILEHAPQKEDTFFVVPKIIE